MFTSNEKLAAGLGKLVNADPWLTLGVMTLLTPEQWNRLVKGEVFEELDKELQAKAMAALRKYPLDATALAPDAAHEVLIKLLEGSFLKNYRPEKKHPRSFMMGCAFNYARVRARSIWRQWRHEHNGNVPDIE
jgi:hypothetical protein